MSYTPSPMEQYLALNGIYLSVPQEQPATPSLAYGPAPDRQSVNRLWRVERGNIMLRRGSPVILAQPVGNGSLYGKANTDALVNGQIDPAASGVLAKGSTPKSVSSPNFAFTAISPTQLVLTWDDYAVRRADWTATLLPAGRLQVDGLTGSTLYYFHPYWSENHKAIGWVNKGAGMPCVAFTTLDPTNVQRQILQGNISFGSISFTMPASGTSTGTTGGIYPGSGGTSGTGGGGRVYSLL